jgi:hypothetical protein
LAEASFEHGVLTSLTEFQWGMGSANAILHVAIRP